MSDAGHAARGVKLTLGGQAVKFAIQLASTVMLARLLSPHDFGLFAMVAAITGFASLLGDFGLSSAAIQSPTISGQQRTNLFWISAATATVLFAALYMSAPTIEAFYDQPGIGDVVRVLALGFSLAALTSQFTAHLTRSLQFGRLSIVDISAQLGGLIVGLFGATAGLGYWSLVAQQITISALKLVLTAVFARWVPGLPHKAPMRPLLAFAANSFGVQALSYVSSNVDSVVLGRVSGATALGLYDRAYQLFKIPVQQIAAPLSRVALPILSRQQGDRAAMSRYVLLAQTGVAYVLGAIFSLGAALAEPVIDVALGPQWVAATPLFSILAIGGMFQVMGYVYYWTFLACGLTGLQLRYSVVTRLLMVALIVIGSLGGPAGVALAVAVGLATNWLVLSAFPLRRTGLDVRKIVLVGLRASLTNGAVAAVVWLADALTWHELPPMVRIACGLCAGLALYGVASLVARPIRDDFRAVFRAIRRKSL